MVIEQSGSGDRAYDNYTRLLKERVVCMVAAVTEADEAHAHAVIRSEDTRVAQGCGQTGATGQITTSDRFHNSSILV